MGSGTGQNRVRFSIVEKKPRRDFFSVIITPWLVYWYQVTLYTFDIILMDCIFKFSYLGIFVICECHLDSMHQAYRPSESNPNESVTMAGSSDQVELNGDDNCLCITIREPSVESSITINLKIIPFKFRFTQSWSYFMRRYCRILLELK